MLIGEFCRNLVRLSPKRRPIPRRAIQRVLCIRPRQLDGHLRAICLGQPLVVEAVAAVCLGQREQAALTQALHKPLVRRFGGQRAGNKTRKQQRENRTGGPAPGERWRIAVVLSLAVHGWLVVQGSLF